MIDDYTKIHTKRRPHDLVTSVADNFCTIIVKVVKEIKAIPLQRPNKIHNPCGVDVHALTSFLVSGPFLNKLTSTFASTMPELAVLFFDPLMERQRLEAHDYHASAAVRSMRSFDDVHLLDFVKLPLKSRENYATALEIVLQSHLKQYLSKFVVLMPGDWPSQFYPRQIVYQACKLMTNEENCQPDPITSIVPCLGPLHVDLNADEDIILNYLPILRFLYETVFPGKKLADKPKPWRMQFTLELAYGGWTLVRNVVKVVFEQCKDVQYGVMLNLFDNYLPLALATYNILFKLNRLDDYFYALFRLWVMFFCFHRRHYNKSPLIFLSNILFWKDGGGSRDIYNLFSRNLNVVDEYYVEHVHSVIRRQTQASDSDQQVRDKVHAIFASSKQQANFRATFTPSKNSVFSRQQLTSLYCKAASVITNVFADIACQPNVATPLARQPGQRKDCSLWSAPTIFGQKPLKSYVLPLGFNFSPQPDPLKRCDNPSCHITTDCPWKLFEGCWHSFHHSCLMNSNSCTICSMGIKTAIHDLGAKANNTFVNSSPEEPDNRTRGRAPGDDDDDDDHDIPSTMNINTEDVMQSLTRRILGLVVQKPPVCPALASTTPQASASNTQLSAKRKRHCSLCKHLKQGHKNQGGGVFCSNCPNNICTGGGGGAKCTCDSCKQRIRHSESTAGEPEVRWEFQRGDVSEWVLSVCQSSVAGQSGSNACTVIAVLVAVNFLLPTGWILPSPHSTLPQQFVNMYRDLMVQGNTAYLWLGNNPGNLSTPEVLQHPALGFSGVAKCGDEYQFATFQHFANELVCIVDNAQHKKLAAVLILPPDKSMVLLIGEMGQLVLLESHSHMGAGAIIAAAGTSKIWEMSNFIEDMARRDWGVLPTPFDLSFIELQ